MSVTMLSRKREPQTDTTALGHFPPPASQPKQRPSTYNNKAPVVSNLSNSGTSKRARDKAAETELQVILYIYCIRTL